jgi:hypothetical protein
MIAGPVIGFVISLADRDFPEASAPGKVRHKKERWPKPPFEATKQYIWEIHLFR